MTCLFIPALLLSSISTYAEDAYIYDFYYEDTFINYVGSPSDVELEWTDNAIHMITLNGPDDGGNGDPYFYIHADEMDGDTYQWAKIRIKNNSNAEYFQMHFQSEIGLTGNTNSLLPITKGDTEFKEYVFNMKEINLAASEHSQDTIYPFDLDESLWAGIINDLRLDCMFTEYPGGQIVTGSEFKLEYIGFFKSESEATAFSPDRSKTPTPKPEATNSPTPDKTDEPTAEKANKTPLQNTTSPTSESSKTTNPFGLILIAIAGSAVIIIAIVIVIIIIKRKK